MSEHQSFTAATPLNGITVLDFGQVYQGPYASFLMAKAGANVIKIEPPKGEPIRLRAAVGRGASLPCAMLNQNKRGITLNLKTQRGRELLFEMARRADVLLENFAPGTFDRLGCGWSVLHEVNPALIYASATGYGLSGPDRDTLAMDLTVQAASGIMSVTGYADSPPVKAGPAVVDFLGATHLFAGILLALYDRQRTGLGRLVEVAMLECVYSALASSLGLNFDSGGKIPMRTGNRHNGLSICPYNVYPTSDGYVAINCVTEEHWRDLTIAMGRPDLTDDPKYATHAKRSAQMDHVDAIVTSWTKDLTKAAVASRLRDHHIPTAVVRDVTEVMNDPHMHSRGMLQRKNHHELGEIVVPASPINLHGAPRLPSTDSPDVGQHNKEVYGDWLGLSDAEIAALKESGVI